MLGNIGNESVFKINTTDKSRRFHRYFHMFHFWEIRNMNIWKNLRNLIKVCKCTFCFSQPTQFSTLIWDWPYLKTKAHSTILFLKIFVVKIIKFILYEVNSSIKLWQAIYCFICVIHFFQKTKQNKNKKKVQQQIQKSTKYLSINKYR